MSDIWICTQKVGKFTAFKSPSDLKHKLANG